MNNIVDWVSAFRPNRLYMYTMRNYNRYRPSEKIEGVNTSARAKCSNLHFPISGQKHLLTVWTSGKRSVEAIPENRERVCNLSARLSSTMQRIIAEIEAAAELELNDRSVVRSAETLVNRPLPFCASPISSRWKLSWDSFEPTISIALLFALAAAFPLFFR